MRSELPLLAIDADAELERLCCAQLQGSWQLPAELVRCALRQGAHSVSLRIGRRRLRLRAEGARLSAAAATALRTAADRESAADRRHRALVEVERAGLLPILAVSAMGGRGVLEAPADAGTEIVRLGRGRAPGGRGDTIRRDLELDVRGLGYPPHRARAWVLSACRFAPRPVVVGGVAAAGAPGPCLAQGRIHAPLPAWIALPETGDVPGLWLLEHGVVAARATVPGQPAFWAAVEMSGVAPSGASGAALRRAVTPHLPALLHAACGLLLELGGRLDELSAVAAQRVTGLLLEAAEVGLRRAEVEAVPLVPVTKRGGGRGGRLSLAELRGLHAAGERLRAVPPERAGEIAVGDGETGVVLGEASRERVACLTGVVLERSASSPRRLRERVGALRSFVGSLLGRGRPGRRELAGDEVTPAEAALLRRLREAIADDCGTSGVALVTGGGRAWMEEGRLMVPRGGREVVRSARAVAADPDTGYAAAVVVLAAVREPALAMRRRFLGRLLGDLD